MSRLLDEHPLCRLRVGPDVELGRRRAVPFADRTAHHHEPLRPRVRMQRAKQPDVRQRPGRDERQLAVAAAKLLGEEVDSVLVARLRARRGQVGAVETRLAVHVSGDVARPDERLVGARVDGDVGATGKLEHLERVRGRLVDRLVSGDRRDRDELELGRGQREQDRNRVVVARVAVEDDRRRGHLSSMPERETGLIVNGR